MTNVAILLETTSLWIITDYGNIMEYADAGKFRLGL